MPDQPTEPDIVATTDRLILRDWREGDADAFYAVMNRPEVMEHLGGVQTRDGWQAAYERIAGFSRDFGHSFWIVEDRKSRQLLGFCGLKRVNTPGAGALLGTPEVGWRLRPEAWGKGIAKEAAIASLDLGFGRFGYDRILAMTTERNRASQALMHRLGMTRRQDQDFIDGRFGPEMNPIIIYDLAAADWPAKRAAALAPRP